MMAILIGIVKSFQLTEEIRVWVKKMKLYISFSFIDL